MSESGVAARPERAEHDQVPRDAAETEAGKQGAPGQGGGTRASQVRLQKASQNLKGKSSQTSKTSQVRYQLASEVQL